MENSCRKNKTKHGAFINVEEKKRARYVSFFCFVLFVSPKLGKTRCNHEKKNQESLFKHSETQLNPVKPSQTQSNPVKPGKTQLKPSKTQ